ncbi:ABC transporter permease [Blastococcus mobilis]|uniref:Putative ABC transport system permease protein n=1 Tax=Blastococcus mobilis TaxID=1938746 RepID=A0A238YEQ1_9ACTN|nr:ABC transporter permease [Blastococcus mobilis]SNR69221.1 putative ABC transport system permease protein [Blastococcus mobilis]
MGATIVDSGPRLVVVLVLLAALAALAGHWSGVTRGRPVLVACLRAAVQLAGVSAVLLLVIRSLWLSATFFTVMIGVATVTAAGRATGRPLAAPGRRRRMLPVALAVAAGAAPIAALIVVSGVVPLRGEALVPIGGILIGGAMTAAGLAGRRVREELAIRRGEVEAALALGLLRRDAVLEVTRPAAATALVPPLDQTRTVGLVTLPGAFVGVLLGGGTPFEAGAAQLLVLIGLLATQTIAVWVMTELVARGRILDDVPR